MRYAKGVAALAMAGALTVAGCGGGSAEPSELDLESDKKQSESASPSPTPTEEKRKQAAIEAAKTWIATANEVRRTLDPAAVEKLESLSTKNCMACKSRVKRAEELEKVDGRFKGDFEEKASNFRVSGDSKTEGELQILADVSAGAYKVIGEGGTIRNMSKASEEKNRYVMQRKGDRWLMREAVSEEEG